MTKNSGFTTFSKLKSSIMDLGVDRFETTRRRREELRKSIIITDRDEVLDTEAGLFEILPDGSIIRVVIHIPQGPYSSKKGREYLDDPENGWHKVHLFWCSKVDNWSPRMRKTSYSDGRFTYPVFYQGIEYQPKLRNGGRPLHLCGICNDKASRFGNFGSVSNFNFTQFLSLQPSPDQFNRIDETTDFDLIPNVYAPEWPTMSNQFKELREWTCEKCFIDLSQDKRFLHAHHRNHLKHDNDIFNLQALCIECHSKEHPNNTYFQCEAMDEFTLKHRKKTTQIHREQDLTDDAKSSLPQTATEKKHQKFFKNDSD